MSMMILRTGLEAAVRALSLRAEPEVGVPPDWTADTACSTAWVLWRAGREEGHRPGKGRKENGKKGRREREKRGCEERGDRWTRTSKERVSVDRTVLVDVHAVLCARTPEGVPGSPRLSSAPCAWITG